MPQARTLTSTWPASGFGSGTSSRTRESTGPNAWQTSAFMVASPFERLRFGARAYAKFVVTLLVAREVGPHAGVVPELDLERQPPVLRNLDGETGPLRRPKCIAAVVASLDVDRK